MKKRQIDKLIQKSIAAMIRYGWDLPTDIDFVRRDLQYSIEVLIDDGIERPDVADVLSEYSDSFYLIPFPAAIH